MWSGMSLIVDSGWVITFTLFFLEDNSYHHRYSTNKLPTTIILVLLSPLDSILILSFSGFPLLRLCFLLTSQTFPEGFPLCNCGISTFFLSVLFSSFTLYWSFNCNQFKSKILSIAFCFWFISVFKKLFSCCKRENCNSRFSNILLLFLLLGKISPQQTFCFSDSISCASVHEFLSWKMLLLSELLQWNLRYYIHPDLELLCS